MILSLETLMTSHIASFLIFLIAGVMFVKSKRILAIGTPTIVCICIFSLIRLIVPIEFFFAKTIRLGVILSSIVAFFRKQYVILDGIYVSPEKIVTIVWLIGSIVNMHGYIRRYKATKSLIYNTGLPVSNQEKYANTVRSVCFRYRISRKFEVLEIHGITTPAIFSPFKPVIVLPANNSYTDQQLEIIFRHEIGHYIHHHLLYQFGIDMLLIVYWWNPLNHLIRDQVNTLLEMSIDRTLASNKEETIEYLQCLIDIVKTERLQKTNVLTHTSSLSLINFHESAFEKRFQIMIQPRKCHVFLSVFLIMISLGIFSLSYCFTLRGYGTPNEEISSDFFYLSEDSSYAILTSNGTYELYCNGEYIETVNTLKGYEGIYIYNDIGKENFK